MGAAHERMQSESLAIPEWYFCGQPTYAVPLPLYARAINRPHYATKTEDACGALSMLGDCTRHAIWTRDSQSMRRSSDALRTSCASHRLVSLPQFRSVASRPQRQVFFVGSSRQSTTAAFTSRTVCPKRRCKCPRRRLRFIRRVSSSSPTVPAHTSVRTTDRIWSLRFCRVLRPCHSRQAVSSGRCIQPHLSSHFVRARRCRRFSSLCRTAWRCRVFALARRRQSLWSASCRLPHRSARLQFSMVQSVWLSCSRNMMFPIFLTCHGRQSPNTGLSGCDVTRVR